MQNHDHPKTGEDRPRKRRPRPLNRAKLEELALAYVARFATSAAKLEGYLTRKLRERGWDDDGEPEPQALVRRYVELGYVDDAGYAQTKASGLLRRGYGPRRVEQALHADGIGGEIRDNLQASEADQRAAALAMLRRRRFGPYSREGLDQARREKQIAAMLRAGHSLDIARELLDAPSVDAAEQWCAEAEDGDSWQ